MSDKPNKKPSTDLNERQQRFVEEYLIDLNATQAAVRAGYSPKGAEVTGSQLLRNPKVQAVVEKRMDARSRRTEVTADRLLQELAAIGFADLRDFMTFDGETVRWKPSDEWPNQSAGAVSEVFSEVTEYPDGKRTTRSRLKLQNKDSALDKIARHLSGFYAPQRVSVGGDAEGEPIRHAVLVVNYEGEGGPPRHTNGSGPENGA